MKRTATSPIEYYTHASIPDRVIVERVAHDNRMLAEELPDDPPIIVEDAIRRMRNLPSVTRMHVWVLRHGRRIVAEANLGWAELESNRKSACVNVSVEPPSAPARHWHAAADARGRPIAQGSRPLLFAHSSGRLPAGAAFLDDSASSRPSRPTSTSWRSSASIGRSLLVG